MAGYILLHRQIQDNAIWQDKPYSKGQAWIDLLLMANHTDGQMLNGNQMIDIKRGQLFRSRGYLANRWGWSLKKTICFIKLLENQKMVVAKGTGKGTLLTIENYEFYQGQGLAKELPEDTAQGERRASAGRQKKECKECNKEINKYIYYGEFQNVMLSEEDLEKLKERFPYDWQQRIETLSQYMKSKGKRYKNHYATILSWSRKEQPNESAGRDSEPDKKTGGNRDRDCEMPEGFRTV